MSIKLVMGHVRSFSAPLSLVLILFPTLANRTLAQQKKQTYYAIFVDNSGSLRSQFEDEVQLADQILERIPTPNIGTLFHFKTEQKKNPTAVVTECLGWTQEKFLLKQCLDGLFVVPGQTALLDAVDSILDSVIAKAGSNSSADRIMFLITDGEERNSQIKKKQLLEKLRNSNVRVYIVGLVKELDNPAFYGGTSGKDKAIDLLNNMAKESGGRAVFLKSGRIDALELLNKLFLN